MEGGQAHDDRAVRVLPMQKLQKFKPSDTGPFGTLSSLLGFAETNLDADSSERAPRQVQGDRRTEEVSGDGRPWTPRSTLLLAGGISALVWGVIAWIIAQ